MTKMKPTLRSTAFFVAGKARRAVERRLMPLRDRGKESRDTLITQKNMTRKYVDVHDKINTIQMMHGSDMNSGYYGYNMSNRAMDAYCNGEYPKSDWTKYEIIDQVQAAVDWNEAKFDPDTLEKYSKDALFNVFTQYTSTHHTGSRCNWTEFYSLIDHDALMKVTEEELIEAEKEVKAERKEKRRIKKQQEENIEIWACKYIVWEGTRNYPNPKEHINAGYIKGKWFYMTDGTKKKVDGNGFEKLAKGTVKDPGAGKYFLVIKWDYENYSLAGYAPVESTGKDLVPVKFLKPCGKKTYSGYLPLSEVKAHPETWVKCPKCGQYYLDQIADRKKCYANVCTL